ncbi:hypothetical protein HG530_008934 [Fusarium avenaceum]|nr:hypothetical protein HG530_008934 [Fusarium avenaceum]
MAQRQSTRAPVPDQRPARLQQSAVTPDVGDGGAEGEANKGNITTSNPPVLQEQQPEVSLNLSIIPTSLVDLQPERIILHIHRRGQHSRLIIRRIKRQAQHNLILALLQDLGIELKLVRDVVTAHRRANRARAALVIKGNSPVIDIAIAHILFWAWIVTLSTEYTPVYVVEILTNIALANLEVDSVREVFDKIPVTPVDAVLFRLQRLGRIRLETVTVFTRGLVGCADSPELLASRLFPPADVLLLSLASLDLDLILCVLPKNVIGIHSETVSSRLYSGNCSSAALVEISPVLVGLCIENVVLKVNAALCENGDGVLGSLGKIDLNLKRSSGLAWYIIGNMLRD